MDKTIIEREHALYKGLISKGAFDRKSIYVGPVNEYSRYYISCLQKDGYEVKGVFDRDPQKKGKTLNGIKIAPLNELDADGDALYCVASPYYEEIHKTINELGVEECNIIKCVEFVYNDFRNMNKGVDAIAKEIEHGMCLMDEIVSRDKHDNYLIFPYNSNGDIFIMGLYKEWIEAIYGDYEFLLFGKSCCDVAKLCGLEHRKLDEYDIKCLIRICLSRLYKDKLTVLHFNYASASVADGLAYHNDLKLIDFYSEIFFEGKKPNLLLGRGYVAASCDGKFDGNAVVLAPYAKSVCDIPSTFWEELAFVLRERGYKVYTNCFGEFELPIYGTEPLTLNFEDMAALLNKGNVFISLRSGLCDVMGLTDGIKIILYSNELEQRLFGMEYLCSDSILEMVYERKENYIQDVIRRMEVLKR